MLLSALRVQRVFFLFRYKYMWLFLRNFTKSVDKIYLCFLCIHTLVHFEYFKVKLIKMCAFIRITEIIQMYFMFTRLHVKQNGKVPFVNWFWFSYIE